MPDLGVSCSTCPYYTASDDKGGICRRNPPQVFIVPGPPDALGRPAARTQAMWPAMGMADWCGEHPMFNLATAMPIDSRLTRDAEGEA